MAGLQDQHLLLRARDSCARRLSTSSSSRSIGTEPILYDPQYCMPFPDGRALKLWVDTDRASREIAKFSVKDARTYPKYVEYWDRVLELIEPVMLAPPAPLAEMFQMFSTPETETLVRDLFLRSAQDLLDEWFESDELKAVLVPNAVIGTMCGPNTPGTAYVLAHHNVGNLDGHKQVWGFSVGGMGGITQALARAAVANGVQIRTGVAVKQLVVREGTVTGVETYLPERRSRHERSPQMPTPKRPSSSSPHRGRSRRSSKKRFAASGPGEPRSSSTPRCRRSPSSRRFRALPVTPTARPSISLPPSTISSGGTGTRWRAGSRPSRSSKCCSRAPSTPRSRPPGSIHRPVSSNTRPRSFEGPIGIPTKRRRRSGSWRRSKSTAPTIRKVVEHWQLISPKDIENTLGMTGGNIFQGDITPDQILSFRPVPGWVRSRTPCPDSTCAVPRPIPEAV